MITTVEPEEKSFENLEELGNFVEDRDQKGHHLPLNQLTLDPEGNLSSPHFNAPLTDSGLDGLLEVLSIPAEFARRKCPPAVLAELVTQLADEQKERVRAVVTDEMVSGVMPASRRPLSHRLLAEWLIDEGLSCEATLGPSYLRITALEDQIVEALPGDTFRAGWEVVNDENGLRGTKAHQYVRRLVCSNGLVRKEKTSRFRRKRGSKEPLLKSLSELTEAITDDDDDRGIQQAAQWAHDNQMQDQREPALDYLSSRLDGRSTRIALGEVAPESTWYEFLNQLTSHARGLPVQRRRRYEMAAGEFFQWFGQQGEGTAPWENGRCAGCPHVD